jgi:hypothetical protein
MFPKQPLNRPDGGSRMPYAFMPTKVPGTQTQEMATSEGSKWTRVSPVHTEDGSLGTMACPICGVLLHNCWLRIEVGYGEAGIPGRTLPDAAD